MNKTSQISVRMTPVERTIIERRAERAGITMSRFLVRSAMGQKINVMDSEQRELYQVLANYIGNFNRLSNLIRVRHPEILREIEYLVSTLTQEIEKIHKINDK
ncbi:DUF1778 domain-containing protein [Ornithobacterium rhinotracheale]|uniref:plasmid mobilization protein n=1 Tax=Ornithobacterium rhinotracheale TaxID=28251 RepID=UPI00129C43DC|nr:DUF1778 domain-containing protein [Ornithobacterium rhinotracheale]MRJ11624.1 DUF1778 domain-containing protein [Ornithobacterium rhinotracheale]